ncbi:MAG TPA: DUF1345 domain-containing protein [Roseiarcus sp.]|nr:DUF1345 domain-containing protein [Roseiarcus sp.]
MPKSPRPPRADRAPGTPKPPPNPSPAKPAAQTRTGFLAAFAHRPRLLAGAILMVAAYTPLQLGVDIREATRLLIAWNVGAWAFLIMILRMVMDPRRDARVQAMPEDENQWVLVALGIVASLAAMAAIVWELGPVKNMSGWPKAGHLALVGATVVSAWTFLQVMFALHYAGVYFQRHKGGIRGGLAFPETPQPGWLEFFYQAFVIGCTFASSDVNVTTMRMRRIVVLQGVADFFFNAIILALTINVAANLF